MAIYLQVRTGPLHLLIDALGVHEVLGLEHQNAGAQGHIEWRGDVLQAVPLHVFFGQPADACDMGVVYSATEGDTPLMFQVEEVIGIRNITSSQWLPLPRLPQASSVFFDALLQGADADVQIYRLRRPLSSDLFKRSAQDAAEAA